MVKEEEATHALDALAAVRRRLPMVRFAVGGIEGSPAGSDDELDAAPRRVRRPAATPGISPRDPSAGG
jgi:hypothetical protein